MALGKEFLRRFTVRQKLWAIASVSLFAFALFGIYNLTKIERLGDFMSAVVKVDTPLSQKTLALKTQLQSSSSAMGLYLLSHDEEHHAKFQNAFSQAKTLFDELKSESARHEIELDGVATVDRLLANVESVFDELVETTLNPQINIPAQLYATEHLNPISTHIIEQVTGILNELNDGPQTIRTRKLLATLADLRFMWARLTAELRSYLAFRNPDVLSNLQIYLDQSAELASAIVEESDLLPFEYEDFAISLNDEVHAFRTHLISLVEIHGARYWKRDVQIVASRLVPLLTQLEGGIDVLIFDMRRRMHNQSTITVEILSGARALNTVLLPVLILLGGLITWLFIRSIVCPLHSAVFAMKDIAEGSGNLNQTLDDAGRDEMSQLAGGFNSFVAKIRGLVELAVNSASSLAEESGRLNEATRRSQEQVQHQRRDIDEISSAVNALSDSAQMSSEKAVAAAAAAAQAHDHAHEGRAVVQDALTAIRDLAREVQDASEVIGRLETESGRIGTVLSVIRTISEQTNLLALNAAIEAARAGEHGRGFAVVADEVRTLSEKIHAETDHIQAMITGLQESSHHAVSAIARGDSHSSVVMEQADKAGAALGAITDSVATITDMNNGIAEIAETQSERSNDIRSKIESLAQIAVEASDTAQQAAASSNEFTIMASQLQDLVAQFLVAATPAHAAGDSSFLSSTAPPVGATSATAATAKSAADTGDNVELF